MRAEVAKELADEPRGRLRDLRPLLGRVRPHAFKLALITIGVLASGALGLVLPLVVGRVVDAALVDRSVEQLDEITLALVGLFALQGLLAFARYSLLADVGARVLAELRRDVFGKLLRQPAAFFEERRVGELLSRLGSDVSTVENVLTYNLAEGLKEIVALVGGLVVVFVLHTRLSLVMLLAVPPVIVIAIVIGRRVQRIAKQGQDALAAASVVAEESLSQPRVVQSFTREASQLVRYRDRVLETMRLSRSEGRWLGALAGSVAFTGFSAIAIVLWYGNRLVVANEITTGQLTSFVFYTFIVAAAIGSMASLYGAMRRAIGASRRVFEILDRTPEIVDAPDAVSLPRPKGSVAFRGVTFRYPSTPDRAALASIELDVRPGEVIALVGRSGSGKSTLVSLLARFYEATEGAVLIDGVDVRRWKLAELRGAIGLVPQETLLFGGTVRENLLFGRPEATDDEVRAAARAARADAFIDALSNGYETVVGEKGVKLSMGQRQRIAIARCLLKSPALLILDEATSSLDAESERFVTEAMEELLRGRTTFVIAHRLSTVLRADRIVVLDAGRIVEQGTHAELLAANGLYRKLFELQVLNGA